MERRYVPKAQDGVRMDVMIAFGVIAVIRNVVKNVMEATVTKHLEYAHRTVKKVIIMNYVIGDAVPHVWVKRIYLLIFNRDKVKCELRVASCELRVASCELRVANCWIQNLKTYITTFCWNQNLKTYITMFCCESINKKN